MLIQCFLTSLKTLSGKNYYFSYFTWETEAWREEVAFPTWRNPGSLASCCVHMWKVQRRKELMHDVLAI